MPSVAPPVSVGQTQSHPAVSIPLKKHRLALGVSWTLCAAWIWLFLLRQWVPHDEGLFADMADRVMRGELPHRDYVELYTGGLAYLDAFAWKVFGRDLA